MDTLSFKTISAKKSTVQKEWLIIDANDQVLGRLASKVALILKGKHKPYFTPHVDCGDYVIIINAENVRMTGKKMTDRELFSHTGYPGGQKKITPSEMLKKKPESLVENAIKGMLPKNRLGSQLYRNLFVYAGEKHPHEAQKPKKIDLKDINE